VTDSNAMLNLQVSSSAILGTLRRVRLLLGWVSVSGVQLPVREIYLKSISVYTTSHLGQLSLAISPWVGG